MSTHLDISGGTFSLIAGGTGITNAYVSPMHVLGKGSWKLDISGGTRIRSDDIVGTIRRDAKYIVWSIHTFLETPVPEGYVEDELFGDIKRNYDELRLGFIYFKYQQWVCSYGMKMVDITHDSEIVLDFGSAFDARFYITDYQIIEFDTLHDANAFVNSREFANYLDPKA